MWNENKNKKTPKFMDTENRQVGGGQRGGGVTNEYREFKQYKPPATK